VDTVQDSGLSDPLDRQAQYWLSRLIGRQKCIRKQLLTQHIMQPTRGANILGMLITKYPDIVHEIQLLDSLASNDHCMTTWTVDIN